MAQKSNHDGKLARRITRLQFHSDPNQCVATRLEGLKRNPYGRYAIAPHYWEGVDIHVHFWLKISSYFRMHRIVKDIAMEWCDFPFGRHHAVPGDEDKPGESSWKLFLNSTDFRESRMRASPAVPWTILISGIPHWEHGPQGARWIGGELSGIFYLEPETPAFSRRVLAHIVELEGKVQLPLQMPQTGARKRSKKRQRSPQSAEWESEVGQKRMSRFRNPSESENLEDIYIIIPCMCIVMPCMCAQ